MKLFKEILFTLFAIAFVTLVPQSGIVPLPFGYSIPVLLFIWLFLKKNKENFINLGFSFKRFKKEAFLVGATIGILLFLFLQYAFFPILNNIITIKPANLNDFASIKYNTPQFIFVLVMGWLVGGFYEEIVFHGFIFSRLEKIITGKYALAISFLITNLIFAFYHWQLGVSGAINAFLAGVVYHALMLLHKRNMWYAIFCHAVFDTIALTLLYEGYM